MEQELPNQPAPDPDEEARPAPPAPDGPDETPGEFPPAADPDPAGGVRAPAFQILRSREERKLGGVAGGLAAATGLDPTLVRLAIVLGCLTGWGILAYLIAWAVIPEEDPAKGRYLVPAPERTAKHIRIGLAVAGAIGVLHVLGTVLGIVSSALIGLGLFPARIFGIGHDSGFEAGEAFLGLILLVGGCLLLFRRHLPWMPVTDSGSGGWFPGGPSGSGAGPSSTPPANTGMALATIAPGSGGAGATAGGYGGGAGGYGPPTPPPGSAGGAGGSAWLGARASAAARAARTNGPLLLVRAIGWLVGLWFLAAAVLGGVFWVTGALRVRFPGLPIVAILAAVGVLGYTLLRSRRVAAVVAAIALLLVPTALAVGVTRVDGQAGDRSVVPRVPSDLDREYRHAIGVLSLDLSALQLPAGQTPLKISLGTGQVEVTVPWDAEVVAKASVGAGSFDLFGNRQTGVNLSGKSSSTGQPGAPVIVITAKAGAGEIIVRRGYEPYTHQALRTGQPVPLSCYPSGTTDPSGAVSNTMICSAADGVTKIPALACVVADNGAALCRPVGEPEPAMDFANDPGTRRCQVPAGGGQSTCTAPIAGIRSPTGQGSFTCTIPDGGGEAVCRSFGAGGGSGTTNAPPPGTFAPATPAPGTFTPATPAPPATPADPNAPAPATTATSGPTAPPGEYRCTVPNNGGPTTCEPI